MSMRELSGFGEQLINEVRDETAEYAAHYFAGRYGPEHPLRRIWQIDQFAPYRRELAELLLHTIDSTLSKMMAFLECRLDDAITIRAGEYQATSNDMLQSYFDQWAEELGKVTPDSLLQRVNELENE